mgnify:CR=1 FL=1
MANPTHSITPHGNSHGKATTSLAADNPSQWALCTTNTPVSDTSTPTGRLWHGIRHLVATRRATPQLDDHAATVTAINTPISKNGSASSIRP